MVCPRPAPIRYEPAWFPLPAWGTPLATEIASGTTTGMTTAHPVPAGLWMLPDGLQPARAGVAASVPPDPTTLTVFIGGCGEPPLVLADIIECLDALPVPERARIVLLPNALATGRGAARLRSGAAGPFPVVAAVPMWSPDGAWVLALIDANGGLTWRPPVERVEGLRAVRRAGQPPAAPARHELAILDRQQARRQAPSDPVRRRLVVPDRPGTPWAVMPARRGFVVEVTIASTGFLIEGKPTETGGVWRI